jgi:small ligand-binding sensory domain FIST
MSVAIGASICTLPDPFAAGAAAASEAAAGLDGAPADLVVVFAAGAHLQAPEALLEGIHSTLAPRALIGCGAGGVLGDGRELESGTAVALWAGSFGPGAVHPFHAAASVVDDAELGELDAGGLPSGGLGEADDAGFSGLAGLPDSGRPSGMIVLTDPYTFPTEPALAALDAASSATPLLGGVASARTPQGSAALFFGEQVCDGGAVGVSFQGVEMIPCVSQGAAPLGRELTITAGEGNVITELAGRPALETIRSVIEELSPRESVLVAGGLLIGIVVDTGQPEYVHGDFLVRGVLGADHATGAVAVGATVHPGQIVRLHARDAQSAKDDLRHALALRAGALAGRTPAGALVFSCNGRGRQMFGPGDHDARAVRDALGGTPTAGFFAAGEIGPVGGRSFLHAFTATVAVFPSD